MTTEELLALTAQGGTDDELLAAMVRQMTPPPIPISFPPDPVSLGGFPVAAPPEAPAAPAEPPAPTPATYPGPGAFNPLDAGQWGAFREMAGGATQGINRMPFVFGGNGGYASLNGMSPSDVYGQFFRGGGVPSNAPPPGGVDQRSGLPINPFGMMGGLGGLGGLTGASGGGGNTGTDFSGVRGGVDTGQDFSGIKGAGQMTTPQSPSTIPDSLRLQLLRGGLGLNPKEYSASEAKRLLDELAPYFAELERRTFEDIVRIPTWHRWSDRKRRCLTDKINVIREVQGQLQSIIAMGKQSARVSRVA